MAAAGRQNTVIARAARAAKHFLIVAVQFIPVYYEPFSRIMQIRGQWQWNASADFAECGKTTGFEKKRVSH
jgi:hypothetical protein